MYFNTANTVLYFPSGRYDPGKGMESLEDSYVSKANALQRKGRAGRVASGVCFHLFSSHHYNYHLLKHQLPEIQRVPLEQLCLRYSFAKYCIFFQLSLNTLCGSSCKYKSSVLTSFFPLFSYFCPLTACSLANVQTNCLIFPD